LTAAQESLACKCDELQAALGAKQADCAAGACAGARACVCGCSMCACVCARLCVFGRAHELFLDEPQRRHVIVSASLVLPVPAGATGAHAACTHHLHPATACASHHISSCTNFQRAGGQLRWKEERAPCHHYALDSLLGLLPASPPRTSPPASCHCTNCSQARCGARSWQRRAPCKPCWACSLHLTTCILPLHQTACRRAVVRAAGRGVLPVGPAPCTSLPAPCHFTQLPAGAVRCAQLAEACSLWACSLPLITCSPLQSDLLLHLLPAPHHLLLFLYQTSHRRGAVRAAGGGVLPVGPAPCTSSPAPCTSPPAPCHCTKLPAGAVRCAQLAEALAASRAAHAGVQVRWTSHLNNVYN